MTSQQFTDKKAAYIITTAIEGGINYWANVLDYKWTDPELNKGDTVYSAYAKIVETDENKTHEIKHPVIKKAFATLRRGQVEGLAEDYRARLIGQLHLSAEDMDIDAADADIVVQVGLFGKVIYG